MPDFSYENILKSQGLNLICGVDEAGRGPLAGPVYAAACILPDVFIIEGLNDSKKLSEKKREALYDVIINNAVDYCVATASVEEIEEFNILNATYLAMTRAVKGLKKVDYCLIDGNRIPPELNGISEAIVKGDSKSYSISAASILAKVSRDRFLLEIDKEYPMYNFKKHKGYGTKEHIELIKKYGACPVHRKSFLTKIWKINKQ